MLEMTIICTITETPCDNPTARNNNCIGCYHRFQQDCHDYYNGIGPLPKEMEYMRIQENADRTN